MNTTAPPDLQAELQDDPSGTRREDVLNQLRTLQGNCLVAKRQLSDRTAYRNLQACGTAVSAAIRIIETLPKTSGGGN